MQLYALDDHNRLIFAGQAIKHSDYICIECGQLVRARSGLHRQSHYYHIQPNRECRMHGKGMVHLLLQEFLKSCLPDGEVELERRFDDIGRIADVAWQKERLIYEIQCSSITAEEVLARNSSYASLGYQVVWIFHDGRYNQPRLTAAEDALEGSPHYFTNMNLQGKGVIYDRLACVQNGIRRELHPRLIINPALPIWTIPHQDLPHLHKRLPDSLFKRFKKWPLGFSGDCLDQILNLQESEAGSVECAFKETIDKLLHAQKEGGGPLKFWKWVKRGYRYWIAMPYRALFRLLLERACR